MKRLFNIYFICLLLVSVAYAGENKINNSEESAVIKAKLKAEKARAGDWKTLADCANTLMKIGICSEDVLSWIEKSISIRESFYNVSLLGDYYCLKQDFTRATENYLKAIQLAQLDNNADAIQSLQWKILITLGTKNYFQSIQETVK